MYPAHEITYLKILLILGYPEPLDLWLDERLQAENPLSELVLSLSFCRSDRNKSLSALNEYLSDKEIDEEKLAAKFRNLVLAAYEKDEEQLEELLNFMYTVSIHVPTPHKVCWFAFGYLGEYYEEIRTGYWQYSLSDFKKAFRQWLISGEDFSIAPLTKKPSFLHRLFHKIFGKRK